MARRTMELLRTVLSFLASGTVHHTSVIGALGPVSSSTTVDEGILIVSSGKHKRCSMLDAQVSCRLAYSFDFAVRSDLWWPSAPVLDCPRDCQEICKAEWLWKQVNQLACC